MRLKIELKSVRPHSFDAASKPIRVAGATKRITRCESAWWLRIRRMIRGLVGELGTNAPSCDHFVLEYRPEDLHELDVVRSRRDKQGYGSVMSADPYGLISRWQMNQGNRNRKRPMLERA